MQITQKFLAQEISDLEREIDKANAFILKAQGTIEAYRMLINRLEAPEPEPAGEQNGGCSHLSNDS